MDFVTIATFISLEVASGFLKEHGKDIYNKAKGLLSPSELISLNLLEQNPENTTLQKEVASALEKHLASNPKTAQELTTLINNLPVNLKHSTITQTGQGNVALQDVHKTSVTINKS